MRKLHLFICVIIAGIIFSGCIDEAKETTVPDNGVPLSMTLSVPGIASPGTRALTDAQENAINTLDVLVFQYNGAGVDETFSYRTHGVPESDGSFRVSLLKSVGGEAYRLVTLVNLRAEVDYALDNNLINAGDAKEAALSQVTFDASQVWDTATPRLLPMWAESSDTYVITETIRGRRIDLTLLRAVARIDLILNPHNDPTFAFTLEDVMVYNSSDTGLAAPIEGNVTGNLAESPSLPSTVTRTKIHYTADTVKGTDLTGLMREIYIAEADNNFTGVTDTDVTCLVIGGYYNGSIDKTWYRIDILATDPVPVSSDWEDILRNHRYTVNVTSVNGPGYDSEQKAFNSKPVNLDTDIEIWDENTLPDVTSDGQYILEVNTNLLEFYREGRERHLVVYTDHPGGWEIETDPLYDWITSVNPMSGSAGSRDSVAVECDTMTPLVDVDREGYICVKAGRMKRYIKITQENVAELTIEVSPARITFKKSGSSPKSITVKVFPENSVVYFIENPDPTNPILWRSGAGPLDYNVGLIGVSSFPIQPEVNNSDPEKILSSFVTVYIQDDEGNRVGQNVTIMQIAKDLLFRVFDLPEHYSYNAGTYSFSVESDTDWYIYDAVGPAGMVEDWSSDVNDPGTMTYPFRLSANHSWSKRSATLRTNSSDPDFVGEDIVVVQNFTPPTFTVTGTSGQTLAFGNTTSTATVNANIVSNAQWRFSIPDATSWANVVQSASPAAGVTGGSHTYNTTTNTAVAFQPKTWTAALSPPAAGTTHTSYADFTTVTGGDAPEVTQRLTITRVVPAFYTYSSFSRTNGDYTAKVVKVTANTNASFQARTINGTTVTTGAATGATAYGPTEASVTVPVNNTWSPATSTIHDFYNNVQSASRGTVTQTAGYVISNPTPTISSNTGNGASFTLRLTGRWPKAISVRAATGGTSEANRTTLGTPQTINAQTGASTSTNVSTNAAVTVGANTGGTGRVIYIQYQHPVNGWKDVTSFTQPVKDNWTVTVTQLIIRETTFTITGTWSAPITVTYYVHANNQNSSGDVATNSKSVVIPAVTSKSTVTVVTEGGRTSTNYNYPGYEYITVVNSNNSTRTDVRSGYGNMALARYMTGLSYSF